MTLTLRDIIAHPFFWVVCGGFLGIIGFLIYSYEERIKELCHEVDKWKSVAKALKDQGTPRVEHYHHQDERQLIESE